MVSPIFKKMVEIYITFRPKCVSCELFHLIWPDKSSPPSTAHGNRQVTFRRNLARQLIGTFMSRKRTGRKRSLPIGTAFPNLFHTVQKVSGRAKVCALCIEKKKKAPSGRGKQTTYKCKQCNLPLSCGVFFGIPRAAKCGSAKLGKEVITCINLLRIRWKKLLCLS